MISYNNRYRSLASPRRLNRDDVVQWLVVANVVVFIAAWIVDAMVDIKPAEQYLPLMADWHRTLHHPWTLLTYMVTHFSLLHLLFNMLWLWWFGLMSQRTVGPQRVLWAYIAGGVVGGILYQAAAAIGIITYSYGTHLVGASASVLCIMTATAIRNPDMEVNLLLAGPIRIKWFTLLCILLALLGLGGGNQGGVVAHIGGIITGAIMGLRERGALQRLELKARMRMNRHRIRRQHPAPKPAAPVATNPEERLNQLLDKIRVSGYASLTTDERRELAELSKNV